jgi:photosystem II stability/assembly factor-like uncharacterized protein
MAVFSAPCPSGGEGEQRDLPVHELNISALEIAPNGAIYAADDATDDAAGLPVGGRGVLASTNDGQTWTNVSAGLPNLDVTSLALSRDGNWLYAGTEGGSIYRMPTKS